MLDFLQHFLEDGGSELNEGLFVDGLMLNVESCGFVPAVEILCVGWKENGVETQKTVLVWYLSAEFLAFLKGFLV